MALLSSNHTANIQWKIREADPGTGNEKFQKRFFFKKDFHPEGNKAEEITGKPGKRVRTLGLFGGKEAEG